MKDQLASRLEELKLIEQELLELKKISWDNEDKSFISLNLALGVIQEIKKHLTLTSSSTPTYLSFIDHQIKSFKSWLKTSSAPDDHDELG